MLAFVISFTRHRLAASLLVAMIVAGVTGCHHVPHRKLDEIINPGACPSCMALDVDCCVCFPHDVAAGFHETCWLPMEEPLSAECSVQIAHESDTEILDIEQIPLPKD